jgi:flavin-dependent thymidylate synthase
MTEIKVELQEHMGGDRAIAESAWTSSTIYQDKNKRTDADVERIVTMLADSGHSTPFESVVMRFWIKMPIQTDRQHMTHRIASHNGMSGRYRTMPSEWLDIPKDVEDITKRAIGDQYQNDATAYNYMDKYKLLCAEANEYYKEILTHCKTAQNMKIITNTEYKRVREFYRGVLPQNNMTERVTTINLRSFANYQRLRNSPDAQPEIRYVAELMLKAVKEKNVCPIAIKALEKNGWMI